MTSRESGTALRQKFNDFLQPGIRCYFTQIDWLISDTYLLCLAMLTLALKRFQHLERSSSNH